MRFGSVCSGIEAASVAWHPIGWRAAWLAEIEPFPSAVLAHHYPDVPNLGDMTALVRRILTGEVEAPDVFTGGTPCQAFSVAGKRESLDDARGNLSLTFCEIANAIDHIRGARGLDPSIVAWENVPGVLSTKDNAFGCFLGALAGAGCELQPAGGRWSDAGCVYGPQRAVAWRVLDAQYFGLAQRRRRVFVVASARNGFDPAAVLFEREGVRRDTAPRRASGQIAPTIPSRSAAGGGLGTDFDFDCDGGLIAKPLLAGGNGNNPLDENLVAFDTTQVTSAANYSSPRPGDPCHPLAAGAHAPAIAFSCKDHGADAGDLAPTLRAMSHAGSHPNAGGQVAVAFHPTQDPISSTDGTTHAMGCGSAGGTATVAVAVASAVRRLTPRECERLQGFPDDYTRIPWRGKPPELCPDGPRYKALGNSWAVPCARWIGQRIAEAVA